MGTYTVRFRIDEHNWLCHNSTWWAAAATGACSVAIVAVLLTRWTTASNAMTP